MLPSSWFFIDIRTSFAFFQSFSYPSMSILPPSRQSARRPELSLRNHDPWWSAAVRICGHYEISGFVMFTSMAITLGVYTHRPTAVPWTIEIKQSSPTGNASGTGHLPPPFFYSGQPLLCQIVVGGPQPQFGQQESGLRGSFCARDVLDGNGARPCR